VLDLFGGKGKDRQYFDHNVRDYASGDWHLGIDIDASEQVTGAFKKVDKGMIAGVDGAGRLGRCMQKAQLKLEGKVRTTRRTSRPTKIAFLSENECCG
jgi:hypothetical protein